MNREKGLHNFFCSVMVDASSYTFQYYKGGIYCSNSCGKTKLNQAMLVVGYGKDASTKERYWILKNRQAFLLLHTPSFPPTIFLYIFPSHQSTKLNVASVGISSNNIPTEPCTKLCPIFVVKAWRTAHLAYLNTYTKKAPRHKFSKL